MPQRAQLQLIATIGKMDRARAVQVAQILVSHINVKEVILFGSLAREEGWGQDQDIDLILIADDKRAAEWIDRTSEFRPIDRTVAASRTRLEFKELELKEWDVYEHKDVRLLIARLVFDRHFSQLIVRAQDLIHPHELNLFVFPVDWRDRLSFLQDALPHKDPKFMENIARDAIPIA